MPDIQLRFHKDMLVLSAPVDVALARQGVEVARDRQYLNLMEPDSVRDALKFEVAAGAQCVVTTTEDITQARLAHVSMDGDAARLASAAVSIANEVGPQHLLVEIGPCGLPLDPSSKASLNENRAQYADAARAFDGLQFDAFFLNGFSSISDLRCALMGVMQASDAPVMASVTVGAGIACERNALAAREPGGVLSQMGDALRDLPFAGYSLVEDAPAPPMPAARRACLAPDRWPEALDVMADMGVSVVGFETADALDQALTYAQAAVQRVYAPVLAQLRVEDAPAASPAARNLVPLDDIDEYTPDTMARAAVKLYGAGVQFLRATGHATPAYTGALAATVAGLDVRAL